jgi:hypothetical protein
MAELLIDQGELTLKLSTLEHAEGFHRDITVPVSSVTSVRVVEDIWSELHGIRAPGTGLPGVVAVGTRRASSLKDFAAVHRRSADIVVELEGQEFGNLILRFPIPGRAGIGSPQPPISTDPAGPPATAASSVPRNRQLIVTVTPDVPDGRGRVRVEEHPWRSGSSAQATSAATSPDD